MAMVAPKPADRPRIQNPRSARTATQTRIVKNNRARYGSLVRAGAVLTLLIIGLMSYVMLTSNLTSLNYAVAQAHERRAKLQEQSSRLDDRIAMLESDDRLAAIAAKLGMGPPEHLALVKLNQPTRVAVQGLPVLDSIAGWFGHDVHRPHTR